MQHDHVLKKLELLNPPSRVEGSSEGGLWIKYLLLCCCICDYLKFDMQHDIVLKKLNYDWLTPRIGVGGWVWDAGANHSIWLY